MNIKFDTPTNAAFESLGALPPGQHWSRFDVPGKAAAIGKAHALVTTIWNYHWSRQGAKRVAKGPAIYRDIQDASLWYRMGRPGPESPPTHVAHWNRIMLAREQGLRIVGVLKDFSTSRCSLLDTFDCTEVLDDINGGAAWLKLRPSRTLSIEVTAVNIRHHVGGLAGDADQLETIQTIEGVIRPKDGGEGQSWLIDSRRRRAVELYAMEMAIEHYRKTWPIVDDVSSKESFDLRCRDGRRELRVEVKGTTTRGGSILLTRNEVCHAQDPTNPVALFVVCEIRLDSTNQCSGGVQSVFEPWRIDVNRLSPIAFEYHL